MRRLLRYLPLKIVGNPVVADLGPPIGAPVGAPRNAIIVATVAQCDPTIIFSKE